MKILFIDGGAGAAGDMLVAALVDLTGGRQLLEEELSKLPVQGFRLAYPPRRRGGVEAAGLEVVTDATAPHFRDIKDVEELLTRATLSPFVKNYARETFKRLAAAEARAHRLTPSFHGFHEVGAVDAIVDVVGFFTLLENINPDRIICSPLRTGFGAVDTAHGKLPVPAPATVELLRGVPAFAGNEPGEFTTPTGAAILATVVDRWETMPPLTVRAVGYGPGVADPPSFPNVLRTFLGETVEPETRAPRDQVAVLEANIDDMTAEELGYAAQTLQAAGALDVSLVPVVMKKGRPGYIIAVVARTEDREHLADLILNHTTTLGVRCYLAERQTLTRQVVTVKCEYGVGKVKIAAGAGHRPRYHAEYESAAALAGQAGVPLRVVARALEEAAAAETASNKKNSP